MRKNVNGGVSSPDHPSNLCDKPNWTFAIKIPYNESVEIQLRSQNISCNCKIRSIKAANVMKITFFFVKSLLLITLLLLLAQAVNNVNSIIGPALVGKVCPTPKMPFLSILVGIACTHLFSLLFCRTRQPRLRLITSWFNSLMGPKMNGDGASKRYYVVHAYETMEI